MASGGVDDVADLAGEVFGGGSAEADGDDGLMVAAAYPHKPTVAGGPSAAVDGAVVAFDAQGGVGVRVVAAMRVRTLHPG